jgi:hypothetical protein
MNKSKIQNPIPKTPNSKKNLIFAKKMCRNMKRIIVIALLILTASALKSQIEVHNLADTTAKIKHNSLVYYLPKSELRVKVIVETKYFIPGPYNKFADKYLTIKGAKGEASQFTEIKDVVFQTFTKPDPTAGFIISSKKESPQISLVNGGIISTYGAKCTSAQVVNSNFYVNVPNYFADEIAYFDLSVENNFINLTDTTYRVVQIDSIFQKIPVYNKIITSKEFEQKAEEAANFIIKIRSMKFELMIGYFDTEIPPHDVDMMIAELDSLEMQYVELFVGKTERILNEYYFTIIPDENIDQQKIKLFSMDNDNNSSDDVYIEITNNKQFNLVNDFYERQEILARKDKNKGLYYRMPGVGTIKLMVHGHVYAEESVVIPQFGYINYLPSKMFKNKNLNIIFDENTGSIKTISNE